MLLPVLLVLFAILAASVFAYGTEPYWASHFAHGLNFIIWARRLEWLLIVAALLLCIALIGLVISKKRRAWWLIGLLPVLALVFHRFTLGPAVGFSTVQDPAFIAATAADSTDELVVGITVDSEPYAFPYSAIQQTPVVVTTLRDKRFILLWSALSNRALVFSAARELRAQDLEIVSSPNNALLIYNSRLGEYINGVTGQTTRGEIPTGFREPVAVEKTTLRNWLAVHPDSKIMTGEIRGDFSQPQPPRYSMPGGDHDSRKVCVVACTQPIAVPSELVTDHPLNLTSGQTSLMLVRIDGIVHAFNRELPGDLVPRFSVVSDPRHKNVVWVDSDTNSEWAASGAVVEGTKEMHAITLSSIPVEDDLYWNVMKFWYPDLHLATDAEITAAGVVKSPTIVDKPTTRRRRTPPRG